jgi:hypothetical protein
MTDGNANLAQSVRQRLLNLARKTAQDYNRLLVRYSLERFLYRIGQSDYAERFVLKGAMLFAVWSDQQYRATQDLDLLGTGNNSPEDLARVFREIASSPASTPDGMSYLAEAITAGLIREDMRYEGVRIRMESRLGNARIPLIVDVGFGDAITPAPLPAEFPALLDTPAPTVLMYPRETVIAEKLEAMVSLGEANSRMKDFADIWFLSQHFDFDGPLLAEAIANTFQRRRTPIPEQPAAFPADFAQLDTKQIQWNAFIRRGAPEGLPSHFAQIVDGIAVFLGPILSHLVGAQPIPRHWQAPGPWQS